MNTHIVPTVQASPFDGIRQLDDFGNEFWSARDLMSIMGYPRWQEFTPAISRAIVSAEAQGHERHDLFRVNPEKSGGRPREDFHLARFACYLVAMNGDPRKKDVADAQAYFAIQTRVAETQVQAAPAELSRMEILRLAMQAEQENEALKREVAAAAPKVDYVDQFVADNDTHLFRSVASTLMVGEMELRWALVYSGWIYHDQQRRRNSKNEYVTEHLWSEHSHKKPYFYRQMNHQAALFKGNVYYSLKITTPGVPAISRLVTKILAEHGTLKAALPVLEQRYNERKAS